MTKKSSGLEVTINVPNLINYLILGIKPKGEDSWEGGGDSRLLYFDESHPFHQPFRWHDKMYSSPQARTEGWARWRVDQEFLYQMLSLSWDDPEQIEEAVIIYLYVVNNGANWWKIEQSVPPTT